MALAAGAAFFDLLPNTKGVQSNIQKELVGPVGKAGGMAGTAFGTQLDKNVTTQAAKTGQAGGKAVTGGMTKSLKSGSTRFAGAVKGGMGRVSGAVRGSLSPVGGIIAGAFGVAAIGGFFKSAVDGASDLGESMSKTEVVFKRHSAGIVTASKNAATAVGLSQQAYLEATSTLGNLLVSLDIAPGKAAGMSQQMVKLAGDLASFNNASPEEALAALRSGLVGETEPLKRFGVNMNQATLEAQALKMGLIENKKQALDPQAKALAAQALIMDQTKTAQGDFARTSGGLANQQRILAAQVQDAKTALGEAFLPIVRQVVTFFNTNLIPALRTGITWLKAHPGVLKATAIGLGIVAAALLVMAIAWAAVTLAASPWLLIVGAIVAGLILIGIGFVALWKRSETFRRIVTAVWNGIRAAVRIAWSVLKAIFHGIQAAVRVLGRIFTWLWRNIVRPVFKGISLAVRIAWAAIRIIFDVIKWYVRQVLAPIFRWLWKNVIEPVWEGISRAISFVWNRAIKPVLQALGDFIRTRVAPAFRKGVDAIRAAWKKVQDAAKAPVNFIIGTVYNKGIKGLFDKVARAVGSKVRMPHVPLLASGTDSLTKASKVGFTRKPTAIVGEGSSRYAESVIPTDPRYRGRAMKLWQETGRRLGMPMMAEGGFLGGIFSKIKEFVTDPVGAFKRLASRPLDLMKKFAGSEFGQIMGTFPSYLLDMITSRVAKLFGGGGNTAAIIRTARRMDGSPYVWGGARYSGADCSGFQSILRNVGLNDEPFQRRMFATASFGGGRDVAGFKRSLSRTSPYQIAVDPGSHMWGRVKDSNGRWYGVESGGSYGRVKFGSTRSINAGQYRYGLQFKQLARGGTLDKSTFPFPLEGMPESMLKKVIRGQLDASVFDDGGVLDPGGIGINLSRRPEIVRTERQWAGDVARMNSTGGQISGTLRLLDDNGVMAGQVRAVLTQDAPKLADAVRRRTS